MTILPQILSRITSAQIKASQPIIGMGSVNEIWDISLNNGESLIIRLNQEAKAETEYPKEKWFIEKAASLGIPGPEVLDIGSCEGYTYMVQTKVEGMNGKLAEEREVFIWRELGRYCGLFSKVKSELFGDGNPATGESDTWERHIAYNISQLELGEEDPAITHGAFSRQMQEKILQVFLKLQDFDFQAGIVHGDLQPRNTIINGDTVYLLDWGTAEFHYQPHTEIAGLYYLEKPAPDSWGAFLEGMGITENIFQDMFPLIAKFHLLKRIDKLRWAIDRYPSAIPRFVNQINLAISDGKKMGFLV